MSNKKDKKPGAHSERGRGRPSRAKLKTLKIHTENPVSDYAAGGSKVRRSLRQFSNDLAKAGYWTSPDAGDTDQEAHRIYVRLRNKLDQKVGFKSLTFDALWQAIRSCRLELNSWVSKRDVLNVYLGLPPIVLVYNDGDTWVYKRKGGQV